MEQVITQPPARKMHEGLEKYCTMMECVPIQKEQCVCMCVRACVRVCVCVRVLGYTL